MPIKTVHTQYELGFSSPHAIPEVEFSDLGFGDPDSITISNPFDETDDYIYSNIGNQGFGDPFGNNNLYIEGNKTKFSDDGGEVAEIRGRFDVILPGTPKFSPIGPFQVDFVSVSTGDSYKAFSGVPQKRRNLFTTINQDKLYVCLPVMPKGLYNIEVFYGDGFINKTTITSGIEIIHRSRYDKALSARQSLPKFLNTGEVSDNIVPGQDYKEESNIAVLTKAFAEICDYAFPNAYTVTTQNVKRNDSVVFVESTLRYPESGSFWIGEDFVQYTGKSATSFTGCTGIERPHIKNTRVETRERDYAAIPNFTLRRHSDLKKPKWPVLGDVWESAFNVMNYGERAAMSVNFNFFYHLFQNVSPRAEASYNASNRKITFTDSDFAKNVFIQKYCRIGDNTYHIETVDELTNTATLTKYETSYWNAAPAEDLENIVVEVLPFWVRFDEGGLFRIEMDGSIFKEDLGFIDKDFINLNIYLGDNELSENESALLRHLASGVKGEVKRRDFYGDKWPLTITQDIRSELLVVEPSRNLS